MKKNRIHLSVKNIVFRLVSIFIPEIKLLRDNNICFSYIKSSLKNSLLDEFVEIIAPYKISDVKIGKGTYLAENSTVSIAEIGKYCSIGPNFLCGWGIHPINGLSTSPMFYSTLKQNGRTLSHFDKIEERKKIIIGNDVFIGANVTILDGVVIGDGAIIGAGAVVSKNISPYAIAIGCPIKILKYRFSQEDIDKLLKIKWWNFGENELKDIEKYFYDISAFLGKYYNNIQHQ